MHRYALRDDQWDKIKDFLPGREGHVGGTAADNRLFVDARSSIAIARASRGAIYLSATDIGRLFTDGTGDGAKVAFSCGFSRLCPVMPTTSS